jgi:hypothetical protein
VSARDIAIDTLTFADLVKLGLEDLPAASQGEWTQHGPVDPGITILELFAWQFEQRLFMGEQLTEPIVRAILRLLGLADPRAAAPAVTVLGVRTPGAANPLAAGTVFDLADGRRFAIDDELWVLPETPVTAQGTLLRGGDELELTLGGDVATGLGGGWLSLLVEVAAAPGVAPAWRPDDAPAWRPDPVDVQPPATLRWEAIGPDGSLERVDVDDSTGALRRSGLLRLPWPAAWDTAGPQPRRLRATALTASYTEPVAILGVHPNAVIARHEVAAGADLSAAMAGFLALPDQLLAVPGTAGTLCDGDGDAVLSFIERDGERHDWRGVRTWVGSGPAERVFLVDRARGELRFGDGRSGRIPRPAAAPDAQLSHRLGAGRSGNAGPFSAWTQDGGAATAVNPVAADDGVDAESLDAARQRANDALSARDRTVTVEDASELARTTPGIGLRRAHVDLGFHPAFPCDRVPGALTVTIVAHADRLASPAAWTVAPQPDAGALATTRAYLAQARLLGQEIFVLAPVYRRVTVDVSVSAMAGAGDARQRIADALREYLDALVGGSEHDGWPFGGPVRPSALAEVVQDTIGPEATVTGLAAALDGGPPSNCSDLAIGPRELVWLDTATVRWVTSSPIGMGLR